jgi:hypothetical protein
MSHWTLQREMEKEIHVVGIRAWSSRPRDTSWHQGKPHRIQVPLDARKQEHPASVHSPGALALISLWTQCPAWEVEGGRDDGQHLREPSAEPPRWSFGRTSDRCLSKTPRGLGREGPCSRWKDMWFKHTHRLSGWNEATIKIQHLDNQRGWIWPGCLAQPI